jgi:hypothetical protein
VLKAFVPAVKAGAGEHTQGVILQGHDKKLQDVAVRETSPVPNNFTEHWLCVQRGHSTKQV